MHFVKYLAVIVGFLFITNDMIYSMTYRYLQKDSPYVIESNTTFNLGYADSLIIEKGVEFEIKSYVLFKIVGSQNAKILIQGDETSPIIFRGDGMSSRVCIKPVSDDVIEHVKFISIIGTWDEYIIEPEILIIKNLSFDNCDKAIKIEYGSSDKTVQIRNCNFFNFNKYRCIAVNREDRNGIMSLIVENNTFENCNIDDILSHYGQASSIDESYYIFKNNIIKNSQTTINIPHTEHSLITNNLFWNNEFKIIDTNPDNQCLINNCVFFGNKAKKYLININSGYISNCIFWNNVVDTPYVKIHNTYYSSDDYALINGAISNCILPGNEGAIAIEKGTFTVSNLYEFDPLFDFSTDSSFILSENSPAINAGLNSVFLNDKDSTRNDLGIYGGNDFFLSPFTYNFSYRFKREGSHYSHLGYVAFMNLSDDTVEILDSNMENNTVFSTDNTGFPLILEPGSTKQLQLKFSPDSNGYYQDSLIMSGINGLAFTEGKIGIYGAVFLENIQMDFYADNKLGRVPFTVKFADSSTGSISSWQWDFENDGIVDSYDQNPTWTYLKADTYSVKLVVSNVSESDTLIKENYIITYSDTIPYLYSIEDIPNDQGGWVRVNFARSTLDTDSLVLSKTSSTELYTVELNDGTGWMAAASTVAYGKSIYSVLVPTTKDSTSEDDGLINFRVIAGMEEGNFVSQIVSGYSVDNIAPSVPESLRATLGESNSVELKWKISPNEDFQYFNIYRNIENYFNQNSVPLSQTINNSFIDNQVEVGKIYYYTLKAIDFSGNKSEYSDVVTLHVTSINENESEIPHAYFIKQNYPNPFNPTTKISYGLPKPTKVKITIFDITGKEIQILVNEKQSAGKYNVEWNGLDKSGKKVASSLYIYEIKAGTFKKVNKMILIR